MGEMQAMAVMALNLFGEWLHLDGRCGCRMKGQCW